jgi:polyhydroxybutyrate depolymerase
VSASGVCYLGAVQERLLVALVVTTAALIAATACGGEPSDGTTPPPDDSDAAAGDGGPPAEGGTSRTDGGADAARDGAVADAAVVPTCTGKTGAKGDRTVSLTSSGQARAFELHVPSSYDPTRGAPVVLLFHGYTMTAAEIATASHFSASADTRGMIVAYPTGLGTGFNAGECCGSAQTGNVDDVGFTRDVLANLADAYCVDPKRTFATGFSNGAFLAYRLACELSGSIAAIAPVAGGIQQDPATCKPKRPVPLLHVHGTLDALVPYLGGGVTLERPISASIDAFRAINACAAGDGAVNYTRGAATCTRWSGCAVAADVELCTIASGGHQWPGGDTLPFGGTASPDLDASERIADFFLAHPMP